MGEARRGFPQFRSLKIKIRVARTAASQKQRVRGASPFIAPGQLGGLCVQPSTG